MWLKPSLWLNDRQPVKVLKSLNDWQSHSLHKFKGSKEPIQFELSYVEWQLPSDSEELYRKSNAWFTVGLESETKKKGARRFMLKLLLPVRKMRKTILHIGHTFYLT